MKESEIIELLDSRAGEAVVVENAAHSSGTTPSFYLAGRLEVEPDEDTRYFVRIGESYHGAHGISFSSLDVRDVEVCRDGHLNITLR